MNMVFATQQRVDVLSLSHSEYAAQLFRTSMFSDCTIRSQHRIWHLHRCILTPRCEFFWKCLQGEFEEAGNSAVEMHNDDPDTLERMLQWIYLLKYPELPRADDMQTAWTGDLMLYMMADKYGLTSLMDATRRALLNKATDCKNRPEEFVKSIEDFADAMQMLYEELPDREDIKALRESLLGITAPVIAKYMRSWSVLQELMTSIPGFSLSLVEILAQPNAERNRSCSSVESLSIGSGGSNSISGGDSPGYVKPYIPLNEDSDEELE